MSENDPLLSQNNICEPDSEEQRGLLQKKDETDHPTEFTAYKRRWYIIVIYSMVAFTQAMNWNTWGPIATSAKAAYGWSNGIVALMPSWGPIMYILTVMGFSLLIETKGMRWATLIGAGFLVVGTGVRCIVKDGPHLIWLVCLGQACNGITGPMVTIGSSVTSATWFPASQRTTATGFIVGIMSIGGGFANILGPLLVTDIGNLNSTQSNTSVELEVIKADIHRFMLIEFGWAALVFLCILVYFPAKPPTPPSLSIAKRDVNFKQGIKQIFRKKNFWFLGVPYSLAFGIMIGWAALIDINLEPLGVSQKNAGLINVIGALAGLITSLTLTRIVDVLKGKTKPVLVVLYVFATCGTLMFALTCSKLIPFNYAFLYAGRIISSACFSSMVPLVFETLCETCYPVPESISNAVLTNQKNFWLLVFLVIFWIPDVGTAWMNWAVVGTTVLCIPLVLLFRETHNRLDVDYHVTSTSEPIND